MHLKLKLKYSSEMKIKSGNYPRNLIEEIIIFLSELYHLNFPLNIYPSP